MLGLSCCLKTRVLAFRLHPSQVLHFDCFPCADTSTLNAVQSTKSGSWFKIKPVKLKHTDTHAHKRVPTGMPLAGLGGDQMDLILTRGRKWNCVCGTTSSDSSFSWNWFNCWFQNHQWGSIFLCWHLWRTVATCSRVEMQVTWEPRTWGIDLGVKLSEKHVLWKGQLWWTVKKGPTARSSDLQLSQTEVSKHCHCGWSLGTFGKGLIKVFIWISKKHFYSKNNHHYNNLSRDMVFRMLLDWMLDNLIWACFPWKIGSEDLWRFPPTWAALWFCDFFSVGEVIYMRNTIGEMHLLVSSMSRKVLPWLLWCITYII